MAGYVAECDECPAVADAISYGLFGVILLLHPT